MTQQPPKKQPASKTLSRGIRILEILSQAAGPLSIDETAAQLGVHRSNVYRLLRTLEDHGLVTRDARGSFALGARLAALAAGVSEDLQTEALPILTETANRLGMTCFLVILDGQDCVTLTSMMPRHAVASIVRHPGTRHAVTVGAPGKALLMQMDDAQWPDNLSAAVRADVSECVTRGYASSHNEVGTKLYSIAAPLGLRGRPPHAIATVYVSSELDEAQIAGQLRTSARLIAGALGG